MAAVGVAAVGGAVGWTGDLHQGSHCNCNAQRENQFVSIRCPFLVVGLAIACWSALIKVRKNKLYKWLILINKIVCASIEK